MNFNLLIVEYPLKCFLAKAEGPAVDGIKHQVIDHTESMVGNTVGCARNEEQGKLRGLIDYLLKRQGPFDLAAIRIPYRVAPPMTGTFSAINVRTAARATSRGWEDR